MFTWIQMFGIVLLSSAPKYSTVSARVGQNRTSCEEFEQSARFNPYLVIDSMWKIFYFWANNTEIYPIVFTLPAKNKLEKFRNVVEAIYPELEVDWHKATLFMQPRPGTEVLMLHASTPGAFRALVKQEQLKKVRPHPEPLLKFADVRMKLVDRYMGMMCCEDLTAYALARLDDVPTTEQECQLAAAKINFKGHNGRSYLYLKDKYADEL
ncbi:hypothetical protein O3G_MSEX008485 [Manduca sexta]|uniref:Uncharacterized protein n=1 Tax=Manduca sexta TaxID=7130 RepID=A0A922CP21_MANSE|nr:hypothetical protein O3G_MSEX008485 [Manduca sexta]